MTVRLQPSATSLSRYATAKSPGVDLYNGSTSRDYCNSFWGVGNDGVNILLARMRGALRTTDELRNFWRERSAIEEEYATRLSNLAKVTLGKDEIGELRNSLDTLRIETESQATSHLRLASQINSELELETAIFFNKQTEHKKNYQAPLEKKFKAKQTQESYVLKAREKYEGDCLRINSYTQQSTVTEGKDFERIQLKLKRARQTVQANEKDFANFTKVLLDLIPGWEADWKEFCDTCQDLEEARMEFMRDRMWAYANAVSTLCVTDDQSCETIRLVLDQLEPDKDVENFVQEYGTGNSIPDPPTFVPYSARQEPSSSSSTTTRPAQFVRTSRRAAPGYERESQTQPQEPPKDSPTNQGQAPAGRDPPQSNSHAGANNSDPQNSRGVAQPTPNSYPTVNELVHGRGPSVSQEPPPPPPQPSYPADPILSASPVRYRGRQPQPQPPSRDERLSPSPPPGEPHILFYVKALYDYTATIDEEFDFQSGDVIAVTATPDDGWWSGELLDEKRRVEGRNIFPSNFVCLF